MLEAAVADTPDLSLDDRELRREGPPTRRYLASLHAELPDRPLCLLLGEDAFAGFPGWRDPERILTWPISPYCSVPGTPGPTPRRYARCSTATARATLDRAQSARSSVRSPSWRSHPATSRRRVGRSQHRFPGPAGGGRAGHRQGCTAEEPVGIPRPERATGGLGQRWFMIQTLFRTQACR